MANQADLVRRTLKLLGKGEAGQDFAAEDMSTVAEYIPSKLEELRALRIADVPDLDDIDPAAIHWLAMLVAQDAAPDFGASIDGTAITLAEKRLRTIYAAAPAYGPQAGVYF